MTHVRVCKASLVVIFSTELHRCVINSGCKSIRSLPYSSSLPRS